MINWEEVPPEELHAAFIEMQRRFQILREAGALVRVEVTTSKIFPQLAEDEHSLGQLCDGLRELLAFAELQYLELMNLTTGKSEATMETIRETELLAELARILFAALALEDFQGLTNLTACRPEIRQGFELVTVGQNTDQFGSDILSILSNPPIPGPRGLGSRPTEN